MKTLLSILLTLSIIQLSYGVPLRLQKRAAFYIANETACVVDNIVYSNGDPIPTDDPCEACKCRPPGFACVLMDCEVKHGCRAVRRAGHCCPEYICGCEHNGRMYRDGDEIRDSQNPCYTCHCQGSSIACAFVDCLFRVDCAPVYVPGECCPIYENCNDTADVPFDGGNSFIKDEESNFETTVIPGLFTASKVEYVEDTSETHDIEDTPVVEIFEAETRSPDLLQLDPEAIELPTIAVNEAIHSAENIKEQDAAPLTVENIELPSGAQGPTEIINSSELPTKENDAVKEEKYQEVSNEKGEDITERATESTSKSPLTTTSTHLHYFTDEIKLSSPSSTESPSEPEESSSEIPLQPEQSSAEKSLQSEQVNNPVVTENTDIEAEEPSNALESGNLVSDYGKSLRFPDQDDAKPEEIEKPQDTTLVENVTSSSTTSPEIPSPEAFKEESSQDTHNETTNSEVLIKDLYYKADEKASSDLIETVTTIVHLKEETQPTSTDATIPDDSSPSTEKGNLLQYADSKLVTEENIATPEAIASTQLSEKHNISIEVMDKEDLSTSTNEDTQSTVKNLENNQDVDKPVSLTTESEQESTTKKAE